MYVGQVFTDAITMGNQYHTNPDRCGLYIHTYIHTYIADPIEAAIARAELNV